ncbi:MAG: BolA family transcriptional regulator [Pedobacter sp.]|nr:MAG: BolA family transcriptional regulator [Pedobacter sp.]
MSSGPIYTVDYLSSKIQKELQAEHVDIEDLSNCGCGMKFDAVIVSPQFEGKPILQRQRLVNQILTEEMRGSSTFMFRFQWRRGGECQVVEQRRSRIEV